MNEALQELKAFGLMVDHLILDGQFHNHSMVGHKPSKKVGWYVGSEVTLRNGKIAIFATYGDFRENGWHTYNSLNNTSYKPSPAEQAEFKRIAKEQAEKSNEKKAASQKIAADLAVIEWNKLSDTGTSQYLKRKQVSGHGVKYGRNYYGLFVAIALRDINGHVVGIQKIYDHSKVGKRFGKDEKTKSSSHTLGTITEETKIIRVSEGYSTAATVYEATNQPTIICFNAGNIKPVAQALREKYPHIHIIIDADNDQWKDIGNTGVKKAIEAANSISNCSIATPKFNKIHDDKKPTDFNDLLVLEGIEEVKRQLAGSQQEYVNAILGEYKQAPTQAAPTNKKPVYISTDEAVTGIKNTVQACFKKAILEPNFFDCVISSTTLLKASAGTGKTRAVEDEIVANVAYRAADSIDCELLREELPYFDFCVKDNKLAKEVYERLSSRLGANVILHQGRNEEYCQRSEIAARITEAGFSVSKVLCGEGCDVKCEFFNQCLYQKSKASLAQVRIFNHAHLRRPIKNMDGSEILPALTIIDEDLTSILINTSSFKTVDITETEKYFFDLNITDTLRNTFNQNITESDFYSRLRNDNENTTPELIMKLKTSLTSLQQAEKDNKEAIERERANLHPRLTDDEIEKELDRNMGYERYLTEKNLLEAIIDDLVKFPDRTASTHLSFNLATEEIKIHQKKVRKLLEIDQPRNQIEKLKNNSRNILLIDADGNTNALSQVFEDLETKSYQCKRKTTTVTQYPNAGFSKKHFGIIDGVVTHTESARSIRRYIEKLAGDKLTLVVTYKVLEETIADKLPDNIKCEHFNNLRGLDAYKDYEQVIVIGRNQPHENAITDEARCLYLDSDEPINSESIFGEQVLTAKNGETYKANNLNFMDQRVQDVLLRYRECEVMQAIDRLRLIHTKSEKHIHILNQLDLSSFIEVDNFGDTKDLKNYVSDKLEEALKRSGGVLPKSPKILFETFPDLFVNIQQVKNLIGRAQKCYIYYSENEPLQIRPKNQKNGKYMNVLIQDDLVDMSSNEILKQLHQFFGIEFVIREPEIINIFEGIEPCTSAESLPLDEDDYRGFIHDAYIEDQAARDIEEEIMLEYSQYQFYEKHGFINSNGEVDNISFNG